ncbi:MAG TPA: hypothetical protein VK826_13865 [Bacteroidia bacterium]|nr:hypothetical protein [Bacteroidia bacterium]
MFEHRKAPLIPTHEYVRRILRNFLYGLGIILFSLLLGVLGYHFICDLPWVDSILNSSMILAGMGPVDIMTTDSAKLFASFYALFSGIAFLSTTGLLLAPFLHRLLHRFHLENDKE